ncbi:hypothetical protein DM02DRAFT_612339 [Periconia macrospinosa]|uniref:Secreted protein n=1 Tax=Periconia macrospinosa TaxID=97972 RepID=A0A2V1DZU0_9PLEO|nr:hypothetical protein DM02DRAFT_612339 [Periconia macrospinosa]
MPRFFLSFLFVSCFLFSLRPFPLIPLSFCRIVFVSCHLPEMKIFVAQLHAQNCAADAQGCVGAIVIKKRKNFEPAQEGEKGKERRDMGV